MDSMSFLNRFSIMTITFRIFCPPSQKSQQKIKSSKVYSSDGKRGISRIVSGQSNHEGVNNRKGGK